MLERVSEVIPELYKFCHLACKEHSILQFGEFVPLHKKVFSRVTL